MFLLGIHTILLSVARMMNMKTAQIIELNINLTSTTSKMQEWAYSSQAICMSTKEASKSATKKLDWSPETIFSPSTLSHEIVQSSSSKEWPATTTSSNPPDTVILE
jgi:hypothetical protein